MLIEIVEAQLDNKNFNTPLPPTTAGLDASPAFFSIHLIHPPPSKTPRHGGRCQPASKDDSYI